MTLAYLVDIDSAVHWLHSHDRIRQRMEDLRGKGSRYPPSRSPSCGKACTTPAIRCKANISGLRDFLRRVSFVGIDEETCKLFGKERGRLRAIGKSVADFDLIIGVTARQHGLTLLTNNRRHFENIDGLQIESLP